MSEGFASELSDRDWGLLAEALNALEETWIRNSSADLKEFVPSLSGPLRDRVLVELIKSDQEFRWQNGEQKRIEDYLAEWPEVTRSSDSVFELLDAECLIQAIQSSVPARGEIQRRYPGIADRVDLDAIEKMAEKERERLHQLAIANYITIRLLDPPTDDAQTEWQFTRDETILIGRSAEADVRVDNTKVSRMHGAVFHSPESRWQYSNLGKNGTSVDGKMAQEAYLQHGTLLQISGVGPRLQVDLRAEPMSPQSKD